MKPFLFNSVFDVNTKLSIKSPELPAIPAVILDDFLKHPAEAHAIASSSPAANWKFAEGGGNFVDYYDCRLRFPVAPPSSLLAVTQQAIEAVWSLKTWPLHPQVDVNWFMQAKPRRADFATPHHDAAQPGARSFTCIVYLNSAAESSGGTAFFRFRPSSTLVPDDEYARMIETNGELSETGIDYWPAQADKYWEKVGFVAMAPGRLLIFPSQFFHAAYHPVDSFYSFPRLTLAYWMLC